MEGTSALIAMRRRGCARHPAGPGHERGDCGAYRCTGIWGSGARASDARWRPRAGASAGSVQGGVGECGSAGGRGEGERGGRVYSGDRGSGKGRLRCSRGSRAAIVHYPSLATGTL